MTRPRVDVSNFKATMLLMMLLVALYQLPALAQQADSPAVTSVAEADSSCAKCHGAIYRSYLRTPMANASGRAMDRAIPGDFSHAPSGVEYRVSLENNALWLSFERAGDAGLRGRQRLDYFLGSGHLGVTYLYTIHGYLLESPVAYYAKKAYDMKPGLESLRRLPEPLPMSPGCMRCHMSGVRREDAGTNNHFQGLPFLHGGITCESCHGETREHVESLGRAPVVDPMKLSAERRDSVCIACHLEGDTRVEHAGRSLIDFKPGERIEDYVTYFTYADANTTRRGVSEIEQLSLSKCKRSSGDRMSCMSCHDVHASPAPEERALFYRKKCLACHNQPQFAATHHPESNDCTGCHMPANKADNIPHVAWTDHRIRQRPEQLEGLQEEGVPSAGNLTSFLPQEESKRDLALAYYNLASGEKPSEAGRAWSMLQEVNATNPHDVAVLTGLGVLAAGKGTPAQAEKYYREALNLNPLNLIAANNLGALLARSGQLEAAVSLWRSTFSRNEDIESLGINLALAQCRLGAKAESEQVLERVLVYSPDSAPAKRRLHAMESGEESCAAK